MTLVFAPQARLQVGPARVIDRGHRPAAPSIARRRLAAQAQGREREARAQVVDMAGDGRATGPPALGGPSKASRSIRVSRLTVTAAGVALMESNRESRPSGAALRDASTPDQ